MAIPATTRTTPTTFWRTRGKAREVGDTGSALLLEQILKDEEEHVDWIEAQLDAIKQMGIENYLESATED